MVMHDTLTSMQEFDSCSSNDDTSDDEWDLWVLIFCGVKTAFIFFLPVILEAI